MAVSVAGSSLSLLPSFHGKTESIVVLVSLSSLPEISWHTLVARSSLLPSIRNGLVSALMNALVF